MTYTFVAYSYTKNSKREKIVIFNTSKFTMFMYKENPRSFFLFFILSNFHFALMNAQIYVERDQGTVATVLSAAVIVNFENFFRAI